MIDLRSDTVTLPTPGMKRAMQEAELGDDVFGEDPTINRLQEHVAAMFGKEAALFVPSGTMSNQIAIRTQTQPGDEILCEARCHIVNFEAGAPAALSGVMCHTLEGEDGILDVSRFEGKVRPANDHFTRTRMVCLENTHNWGGGRIYPIDCVRAISTWAREQGLLMHLDGARIWNAIVATGVSAKEWGDCFDTVSVCFSKGLGAPVGSALLGSRAVIDRARKIRKMFGGGMRQGGVLAAAALYAVEHQWERLAEDHRHARILAEAVEATPGLRLNPTHPDTNIVWFEVEERRGTAREVADELRERGVLVIPIGPQRARACLHLDVSEDQVHQAAQAIRASAR